MSSYYEIPAHDWTLELDHVLDSDGEQVAKNLLLDDLDSFEFSGSKKDADTGTFDDAGRDSHMVMTRGNSMKIAGKYNEDTVLNSVRASWNALDDLAQGIGRASLGSFILTSPAGKTRTFYASVVMDNLGGGRDDVTLWGATLTSSGAMTKA